MQDMAKTESDRGKAVRMVRMELQARLHIAVSPADKVTSLDFMPHLPHEGKYEIRLLATWHEVRDVRYLRDVNFGNRGAFGADHDVIDVGQGLVEFGSECWDDVVYVCKGIRLCMFAGG